MPDLRNLERDASPPQLFDLLRANSTKATPDDPWVLANMVSSLDGRAAVDGRSGKLGGPLDREMFQAIRALSDVILVGAATVRAEGYRPVRLSPGLQEARLNAGMGANPTLAVLSRSLTIPEDTGLLDEPDGLIMLTGPEAPADRQHQLTSAGIRVEHPDAPGAAGAIDHLQREGMSAVLAEGGPSVLADIIAAGRLDELCLTMAPRLLGGGLPLLEGIPADPRRWQLQRCWTAESDLFLSYCRGEPT